VYYFGSEGSKMDLLTVASVVLYLIVVGITATSKTFSSVLLLSPSKETS